MKVARICSLCVFFAGVCFAFLSMPGNALGGQFSFVVLGDNRPNDPNAPQPAIYGEIIREINLLRPAFVVHTGDMILSSREESVLRRQWKDFLKVTKKLDVPFYPVVGNHDAGWYPKTQDIYREMVRPDLYYSFDFKDCHFVILDTEVVGNVGKIGKKQLAWLKVDLEKHRSDQQIFVFLHRPIYPKMVDGNGRFHSPLSKSSRDSLARMMTQYRVKAVFAGHEHLYDKSVHGGVTYYITGGSGAPLYAPPTKGGIHHYLRVAVDENGVTVTIRKPGSSSTDSRGKNGGVVSASSNYGRKEPPIRKDRGRIVMTIVDKDTGRILPVRVYVKESNGKFVDGSHGGRIYRDGRFYAAGNFWVDVLPGDTKISIRKGFEYVPLQKLVKAVAGERLEFKVYLKKFVDMRALGWYSADTTTVQHDKVTKQSIAEGRHLPTSYEFARLVCKAEDLGFVTEEGSPLPGFAYDREEKEKYLFSDEELVFVESPERRYFYTGHIDTPGLIKRIPESYAKPLPILNIIPEVHKYGGVVKYTHPVCFPLFHWMSAMEVFSDVTLGQSADLYDVSTPQGEKIWYSFLNAGAKLAVSNGTDSCLERKRGPSPGFVRTYVSVEGRLDREGVVKGMREGRTFITNGPLFSLFTIDGKVVGDTVSLDVNRTYSAKVRLYSLNKIFKVDLIRNGVVTRTMRPKPDRKTASSVEWSFTEQEPSWYVVKTVAENGQWALTSPIYIGKSPQKPFAYTIYSTIGNFNGRIRISSGDYFIHIFATVSEGAIQKVKVLRNGQMLKEFSPTDGDRVLPGRMPVISTGHDKAAKYEEGWIWYPDTSSPRHFQADYPVREDGKYRVVISTKKGNFSLAAIDFVKDQAKSRQVSGLIFSCPDKDTLVRIKSRSGDKAPGVIDRRNYVGWYGESKYWQLVVRLFGQKYEFHKGDASIGTRQAR